MLSFIAFLVTLVLLIFVSLSVFGGGQVFMPIFVWLWKSLNSWFKIEISEEFINTVFAVSNSTPGILSPKFAAITGYMIAQGQWWGFIAMIFTYLAFVLPAIFMMMIAIKYSQKFHQSTFFKRLIVIMNPVVAGIIIALAIEIFISCMFPYFVFNESVSEYWKFIDPNKPNQSMKFFIGWRLIALYCYVPIGIIISLFLYLKKVPIFGLIFANIIFCLVLFEPWLG
ncbi:chromate transporter [Mycoplasma capricolum]|uniref:chromate transporter n=1 Tax=Mycoplasma capricolum TaxID=2095 RepID=UPI00062A250B|nr:chromate transporter [Mycoplasma capricolum]KKW61773.1 putative chromate ion transporter (CHR) family [Mycoplasma capricolum subsp. capricolum]